MLVAFDAVCIKTVIRPPTFDHWQPNTHCVRVIRPLSPVRILKTWDADCAWLCVFTLWFRWFWDVLYCNGTIGIWWYIKMPCTLFWMH